MMVMALVLGHWRIAVAAVFLSLFSILGFAFVIGKNRQALYDRWSGTRVYLYRGAEIDRSA
jgi:hypothetical protein